MPNLIDLSAELHAEIAKNVPFEAVDCNAHSKHGDLRIFGDIPTIKALRSLSPYWAGVVDQLIDIQKAKLEDEEDKADEDNDLLEKRITQFFRDMLLIKS